MTKRAVVAGNWKMHHGPGATRRFFEELAPRVDEASARIMIFPPALSVAAARERAEGSPVELGVQNIHWESSGAFTGELSAPMAAEAGARLVLVGHSERRHVFGETDDQVALKVNAAVQAGLIPVICVGETLEQRREGRVDEVISSQLRTALGPLVGEEEEDPSEVEFLVAYEPVWAIGTGETATPSDASDAHRTLRTRLGDAVGFDRASEVSILYGGSVKPHNAAELLSAPDVDGVLVGGASLEADSFGRIISAA